MNQLEFFTLAVAAGLFALAAAVTLFARRAPMADSPWFWVCVFSTAATVALFVMEGKYGHRQGHIEDEYRFGTRTLQKPPADSGEPRPSRTSTTDSGSGGPRSDSAASDSTPLGSGPQPQTHELLISLAPLRFIAIGAMIISWIALQWRRVRGARERKTAG